MSDATALSKLNNPISVPIPALTLTAVRIAEPPYACCAQTTVVADVHAVLPHTPTVASEAVAVGLEVPRLSPPIVTVPLPVGTVLAETVLTTGTAQAPKSCRECRASHISAVPSKVKPSHVVVAATFTHNSRAAPAPPNCCQAAARGHETRALRAPVARTGDGDGAAQTSCVAVVQVVVRHGWPERNADGLRSMLEKPAPWMVTVAALETWMFTGAKEETHGAVRYVGYALRRVVPQAV
jgi:hypothetical protein